MSYRALISVPVVAQSDDDAYEQAQKLAASVGGSGHVEAIFAVVAGDLLRAGRAIWIDPGFEKQIP